MEVNVHEAKTQLSRLLKRVAQGDDVTISRAGVPVAKLIAVGPKGQVRPMGMDRKNIWMAEDFDAPDPELETLFYRNLSESELSRRCTSHPTAESSRKKKKKA